MSVVRTGWRVAAYLSHRLHAPLTALRLDTDALPTGDDDADRISADADARERAVTQVIADRAPESNGGRTLVDS